MANENVSGVEHERLAHSHAGRYAWVWIALVVFTFLTWGLSRLHLGGGWGVVVALSIAVTKGSLVALFFMHLWDQRGANRLVFVTSLVFVALLIGLVIAFMSSLQLKQFGAYLYVASLVAIAIVRELGPLMTAILLAGRSGSATTTR